MSAVFIESFFNPVHTIQVPFQIVTGLLQQPLQLLFLFNSTLRGNYNQSEINAEKVSETDLEETKMQRENCGKTQVSEVSPFLIPISSLLPLLPQASTRDLEIAENLVKMMTTTAALPAVVNITNLIASQMAASSNSMYSQTPFGSADDGPGVGSPSAPPDQSAPSVLSQQASSLTVEPLDPSLTPYSTMSEVPVIPATIHSLIQQSSLPLTQAGGWKSLNLFAVGVLNSYGYLPNAETEEMNQEFITSLISSRFPFSPIVFASLTLDVLAFVNTTQHLLCPPREAYNAESLSKMLFLRSSNVAEAFAKISLDYFYVASIYFVKPTALRKQATNQSLSSPSPERFSWRLPLFRFSTPSIASVVDSAAALSTMLRPSMRETKRVESNQLTDNRSLLTLNFSEYLEEVQQLVRDYNLLPGSELFLGDLFIDDVRFVEAGRISIGPIGHELLGLDHASSRHVSSLPPIANAIKAAHYKIRHPETELRDITFLLNRYNFGLPFMSKTKRLHLQQMGLMPGTLFSRRHRSE